MISSDFSSVTTPIRRLIPNWMSWLVYTFAAILVVTGLAKVWTAFSHTKLLTVIDPVLGVQFGHLMLAVGGLEIAIAGVCVFRKLHTLSLALVAWLGTLFCVYRIGFVLMDWHRPCGCLGNLTDALRISPQTADTTMKIILAYLLVGSFGSLIWIWRQKRLALRAAISKQETSASES
jgi:hypothetical protein